MLSIYTYPDNSGTGYIDPLYYGATTPGSETGYFKRITDLKAGTNLAWPTGSLIPTDTVADLITATGLFHKGVDAENGLENISIYSYWNQPLATIDAVLITEAITSSDTAAVPAVRLTVDTSDLLDSDLVGLTNFDGTLAEQNNNNYYVDVINATTADLYYDSALSNPLFYLALISGQAVSNIDYDSPTPETSPVKVTLTGLGAAQDGSTIDFITSGGSNKQQDRLNALSPLWISHDTGSIFNVQQTQGGGNSLKISEFLNNDYTNLGEQEVFSLTGTGMYQIGVSNNRVWRVQKKLTTTFTDGLKNLPYADVTTRTGGATTINGNIGTLKTLYYSGYANGDAVGSGLYVKPIASDDSGVGGNAGIVNAKKGMVQTWQPRYVYTNFDGLSKTDGGQDLTNVTDGGQPNSWMYDDGTSPLTNKISGLDESYLYTDPNTSKSWKVSLQGQAAGTTVNSGNSSRYNSSPALEATQFGITIDWPTNTSNLKPNYINFYSNGTQIPVFYQRLVDIYNSNPYASPPQYFTNSCVFADFKFTIQDLPTGMILLPVAVIPGPTGSSGGWGGLKCVALDPNIWNKDYKGDGTVDLSGAIHGNNYSQSSWINQTFDVANNRFYNNGNYEAWSESRFGVYSDITNTFFDDIADLNFTFFDAAPGTSSPVDQIDIPNTSAGFELCRTGTILEKTTVPTDTRYLRLVSATSYNKVFSLHSKSTGPTDAFGNYTQVDWYNKDGMIVNAVKTKGENWFDINPNTNLYEYWQNLTTPDVYFEASEIRVLNLDETAGTTADIGAPIVDSTTGDITLQGTTPYKASNPHMYFGGTQTYIQRTGESTYVDNAFVKNDAYDINSSTATDLSTGTLPTFTIGQTNGYINSLGVSAGGSITKW